jgi:hypothetical protein
MYVLRNTVARSRIVVAVEKQSVLLIGLCVHACVRACVLQVPGRVGVCMRVRACSLAYPASNMYAPYCDVIFGPSVFIILFDIIS